MIGAPLVVVAPHPDDEVLGAGTTIAGAVRAGHAVHVIILTDGEAQRDPAGTPSEDAAEHARSRALAERRRGEARAAAAALGVPGERVHHLGLPDLGLFALYFSPPHTSPWTGRRTSAGAAEAALAELLGRLSPARVVVSHPGDRHRDHAAAYCFVDEVLRALGSEAELRCYLIHGEPLPPPKAAPDRELLACKRRALATYASQRGPFRDLFARAEDSADRLVAAPAPLAVSDLPRRVRPLAGGGPELALVHVAGQLRIELVDLPGSEATLYARGRGVVARLQAPGRFDVELGDVPGCVLAGEWRAHDGSTRRGVYPRLVR